MPSEDLVSAARSFVANTEIDRMLLDMADEIERLRELLRSLIDNVETGSYESTGQCLDECKRELRK